MEMLHLFKEEVSVAQINQRKSVNALGVNCHYSKWFKNVIFSTRAFFPSDHTAGDSITILRFASASL